MEPTEPLLRRVDSIQLQVPDIDAGLAYYRDRLGLALAWRSNSAAGLSLPDTDAELVLQAERPGVEVDLVVASADRAADFVADNGGRVVVSPFDIPIGRCAVVDDPWGNRLVLLDDSKGKLATDASGAVLTDRAGTPQVIPRASSPPHMGDVAAPTRPVLVIFAGVPGTGKTTLATFAGEWLNAPVFSKDELEATLWRSGIRRDANSGFAAYELMTTLADGQLARRQSAVLDSVATFERIRAPWRALALRTGADLRVIETICSDTALQRTRLATRRRDIPGWPELTWDEALNVAGNFEPVADARLILDAAEPLASNLRALRDYLVG
jgi:lactoylglutathione lyase